MKLLLSVAFATVILVPTFSFAKTLRVVQTGKTFIDDTPDAQIEALTADAAQLKSHKVEVLKANVGDKLTFSNRDIATHNINANQAGDTFFDLGAQPTGVANDKTVDLSKKGEFEVRCAIHPKMKLKLVVE